MYTQYAHFQIGASIYASNIGAPMFIGLAGTAAANGFSVTIYEWHVSTCSTLYTERICCKYIKVFLFYCSKSGTGNAQWHNRQKLVFCKGSIIFVKIVRPSFLLSV